MMRRAGSRFVFWLRNDQSARLLMIAPATGQTHAIHTTSNENAMSLLRRLDAAERALRSSGGRGVKRRLESAYNNDTTTNLDKEEDDEVVISSRHEATRAIRAQQESAYEASLRVDAAK